MALSALTDRFHFVYVTCMTVCLMAGIGTSSSLASEHETQGVWRFSTQIAGVYRGAASVEDTGDVSRESLIFKLSARRNWTERLSAGISLGYGEDRYDFQNVTSLGPASPWENIQNLSLSLPIQYQATDAWNLLFLPSLRYNAEKQADLGDGQTTGLLAAAGYRFNDRLTLGPGMGYFSDLDGGSSLFPILLINWQITESLSLETGRGFAASRGPGLTLRWQPTGPWTFSLSSRYEKLQFRLRKDGIYPDGIGEERAIPVVLGMRYAFSRKATLNLLAGTEFAGNLRVSDKDGNKLSSADFDPAPMIGAIFSYRF